jgi:hypothetical protein
MRKITAVTFAALFMFTAISAEACPKGQHLTGGTGAHHKGGHCIAKAAKAPKAA